MNHLAFLLPGELCTPPYYAWETPRRRSESRRLARLCADPEAGDWFTPDPLKEGAADKGPFTSEELRMMLVRLGVGYIHHPPRHSGFIKRIPCTHHHQQHTHKSVCGYDDRIDVCVCE